MENYEFENILKAHGKAVKSAVSVHLDLKNEIRYMERKNIDKPINRTWIKKTITVTAILMLCVVTITVSPAANYIKGYFKDIFRFDGAIIGTEYIASENDLKIDVLELYSENDNVIIPLNITFENKNEAPFIYIQELMAAEYKILDSSNKKIEKIKNNYSSDITGNVTDGNVSINLLADGKNLKPNEKYTVYIELLYGISKGDAPLEIKGDWSFSFYKTDENTFLFID